MTIIAHNAAIAGLTVDTVRLWEGDDEYYEMWLEQLANRVLETYRKADG